MRIARSTDPDTSREGDITDLRKKQQQVLSILIDYGPLSDHAIKTLYENLQASRGFDPQSASGLRTRRKELVDRGLVRDSGQRVQSRESTRRTIVWEAT